MKFRVGDKVRLNPEIKKFTYGKGNVKYIEIGTIIEINDTDVVIYFPSHYGWLGIEKELILVSRNGEKTFFKKLPNNYTGTIEIKNGYIVEGEILDKEEKEYLSAVIRPFKERIMYIALNEGINRDNVYVYIELNDSESIDLPYFKKGTMYKDMKVNKEYTLKELGLD